MMRPFIVVCFLFVVTVIQAQTLTLEQLKAIKSNYQPELIQVPDSAIVYPVTGLVDIHIASSLMGETIVEVEVWVVDAKGKIVYNSIFAARNLSDKNFDFDYAHLMKLQGKRLLRKRHFFTTRRTSGSTGL